MIVGRQMMTPSRFHVHPYLALCVMVALAGCHPAAKPQLVDPVSEIEDASASQTATTSSANMDHSHLPVALPDGVPVPTLSINVSRDWMSGLNLELHTENYEMTVPPVGLAMDELMAPSLQAESGIAEGHAHLYINGEKFQRIYGHHLHLPAPLFKPGLNQINVSINTHGHMYWTAGGRQVLATLYVNLDDDDLVTHRFETYPTLSSADGSMCVTNDINEA